MARAFLQLRQALRVTDSGTLRRFDEELLSAGVSFSPRGRRGSDPVLSDVDWLGLLADALLSPKEGRILRKFEEDMFKVSKERRSLRNIGFRPRLCMAWQLAVGR